MIDTLPLQLLAYKISTQRSDMSLAQVQKWWYNYAGLANTSYVLFVNSVLHPWASREAMLLSSRSLYMVNLVDLLFVGHMHLAKNNYSLIVHHIAVIAGTSILHPTFNTQYTATHQAFIRYILLTEVSSWFNSVRYLIPKNKYPQMRTLADYVFGMTFVLIRSVSSLGSLHVLLSSAYAIPSVQYYMMFWYVLTSINVYWGEQIVRKALKYPSDQLFNPHISPSQRIMQYAAIALPLMFVRTSPYKT